VNTILVDRADRFGLSQLYQLRGRVGRGALRGNCLLLTPEKTTSDARKRLSVLVENTRLGSGFHVAAADLEIRGGGNLLGDSQSGNIDAVGYDVWISLLEEAVVEAKGDAERRGVEPEVHIPVDAFLPEQGIPDMQERLGWYRALGRALTVAEVDSIESELEGRLGQLEPEVQNLLGLTQIQILCRYLGITHLQWKRIRLTLQVHPKAPRLPEALQLLAKAHPKRIALTVEDGVVDGLHCRFTPEEAKQPVRFVRWLLSRIQSAVRELQGS